MPMTRPDRPTLVCLHGLGGSARIWSSVADRLPSFPCVCVDLPGFGDASALPGRTVDAMADHVAAVIRALAPLRTVLVGHSMGAKVAAVLARRSEDGEAGLEGLLRLVLLAGSPPGPEPMTGEQRATMLGWFAGDPERSRQEADGFIAQNVGDALEPILHEGAADDILRADRGAWRAWLECGSREDLSSRVGRLRTPTLLVAGGADGPLGRETQDRIAASHFERARVVAIDGAGHLLPLERPGEVARLIEDHVEPSFLALLQTDRVSARTRDVNLARAAPDYGDRAPVAVSASQIETLRTLADHLVPQSAEAWIDLAAQIDAELAAGIGDGWRFAELPSDREAYRAGLDTLEAAGFATSDTAGREALLRSIASGDHQSAGPLTGAQMALWFEEVRAEATRAYMAHPATLARIGYSGLANGGDGERKSGFVEVGLGRREDWEPVGTAH